MSVHTNNNKFISYLIILITFFILILFTKWEIFSIQENIDLKDSYSLEFNDVKYELAQMNNFKAWLSESTDVINKFNIEIKEDEIIDYLYSFIEETNRTNWVVLVKNITISNPKKTELWFNETKINLNLLVPTEDKLKRIIKFLTSPKSKYNFYIESFSYPYWKTEWNFSINIPLKILYK